MGIGMNIITESPVAASHVHVSNARIGISVGAASAAYFVSSAVQDIPVRPTAVWMF
jgi:hypothetical protein